MTDDTPAAQLDELIATTFDKVKPVLADQITNENPLLAALNSKGSVTEDGGLTIRHPVLYAFNDTVGSYSDYDLLDTTPQDGFGYAEYDWKQYAGTVTISGRDERLNAGTSRIIPLLKSKIEQLRLSIEEDLNAMLWANGTEASATGNSGKDFLSITHIVGDGITYGHSLLGGIDSDSDGQSWWRSGLATSLDLTTLDGLKTMNSVRNSRRLAKSKPDFIFCEQEAYEAYEALCTDGVRFASTSMGDLGFDSIAFHNAELMFEDDVPTARMYFLNTEFLKFVKHSDCWLEMGDFKEPVNQDAKVAKVIAMGELTTNVRRAHAVIGGVVTS